MSDNGTIASIRGGWQNWYDKQEFYRSTDGTTWDKLPSHTMHHIAFGYTEPSPECPQ